MSEPARFQHAAMRENPEPPAESGQDTPKIDTEFPVRLAFSASPEKGFEALFRLYYTSLCSHALRFVYRREVAEDIVAEVFYQFWKSKAYEAVQFTYRTYLYAAVRNRAYNYLRDELTGNRAPAPLDEACLAAASESPQTLIEYDETFRRLEKAIGELPSQCQRVFLMSRFENRRNHEVAAELGIALKTVETHLSKALCRIRRAVLVGMYFIFCGIG